MTIILIFTNKDNETVEFPALATTEQEASKEGEDFAKEKGWIFIGMEF